MHAVACSPVISFSQAVVPLVWCNICIWLKVMSPAAHIMMLGSITAAMRSCSSVCPVVMNACRPLTACLNRRAEQAAQEEAAAAAQEAERVAAEAAAALSAAAAAQAAVAAAPPPPPPEDELAPSESSDSLAAEVLAAEAAQASEDGPAEQHEAAIVTSTTDMPDADDIPLMQADGLDQGALSAPADDHEHDLSEAVLGTAPPQHALDAAHFAPAADNDAWESLDHPPPPPPLPLPPARGPSQQQRTDQAEAASQHPASQDPGQPMASARQDQPAPSKPTSWRGIVTGEISAEPSPRELAASAVAAALKEPQLQVTLCGALCSKAAAER